MPITNLYIDQGIDYEFPLELWSDDNVPLPLTNYQVFGQIRKFYGYHNIIHLIVKLLMLWPE